MGARGEIKKENYPHSSPKTKYTHKGKNLECITPFLTKLLGNAFAK